MSDYSEEWAEAVRGVVGDTPYRTVARKAGLSASYVGDMVQGRIPKREAVLALARAIGASPAATDRLLVAAGYAPLQLTGYLRIESPPRAESAEEEVSGDELFMEGLRALAERFERPIPVDRQHLGHAGLTPEQARAQLQALAECIEAGDV